MFFRFRKAKLNFERPMRNTKYTMLKHKAHYKNPERVKILYDKRLYTDDGLNTVEYKLVGRVKHTMLTHFLLDVGMRRKFVPVTAVAPLSP